MSADPCLRPCIKGNSFFICPPLPSLGNSSQRRQPIGTLRVLVAGGNEIDRKGLCAIVQEQGWEAAAEVRDSREALEIVEQIKPDVTIMDMDIPSLNGLEATRQIAKLSSQTRVLLLASHDKDQSLPEALEAGADAYLLKSDSAEDLISAVEAVASGRSFLTTRGARDVLDHMVRSTNVRRLSVRQREVLTLVAQGCNTKQVGAILKISVKTAETHRANLMQRIDCHSVVELVRYAIRNHVVEA